MRLPRASLAVLASALAASAAAQQVTPETMLLAQAHDRCMTTQAVRLTRTAAADEAIFASAQAGCRGLRDQLTAAIARDLPAGQASELTAMLDARTGPEFTALLARIRAGRAANSAR